MSIKGQAGTATSLDLQTSVELAPSEISIGLGGKIVITLPGLKVRFSEIKIGLLFLPLLHLGSMEITTEPTKLDVDLSGVTIQTKLEKVTQVQVVTRGEIKANATLEGSGTVTTEPIKLAA